MLPGLSLPVHSQTGNYEYTDPKPGAKFVMPGTDIAVRFGEPFDPQTTENTKVRIAGSESGPVPFKIRFSGDRKTLYLDPDNEFAPGERVEVELSQGLATAEGIPCGAVWLSFTITPELINPADRPDILEYYYNRDVSVISERRTLQDLPAFDTTVLRDSTLPEDFPEIRIQQFNEPQKEGYYFIAPSWGGWVFPDSPAYLIIFDHYGTPVFYQKSEWQNNDLRLQGNGQVSYWNGPPDECFIIFDSHFNRIDEYRIQNGYGFTDHHEFLLFPNGHSFITTIDPQLVGMDTVVPGGDPNATVIGFIFQELDENKDVVFQWRSWDHYDITDVSDNEDLTAPTVDYVHGNAIEVESDTSLLISSRNLDEITKIHRGTGEIIWRLGGKKNQFTFINDPLRFSYQHDIRRLTNGNVSLFDNGTYHPDPAFSSVIEYELDEANLTATLVRRIRNNPDILGLIMGNGQEVDNGGFVIGWGSGVPGITEFHPDGSVAMEIFFNNINYRAYRFNWETDAFELLTDTIDFGETGIFSPDTLFVSIKNNMQDTLEINHVIGRTGYFYPYSEALPALILPDSTGTIGVIFEPDSAGIFTDLLTVCNNIQNDTLVRRIARQIPVTGRGMDDSGITEAGIFGFRIFPNPSSDGIFRYNANPGQGTMRITVFDISGRKLSGVESRVESGSINLQSQPGGVYIIRFESEDDKVQSLKVIKR